MLDTGKIVYNLLINDGDLQALLDDKIFSLVAQEKTTLPFIICDRSFNNDFTKDGYSTSTTSLTITIFSDKYDQSIDIAIAVNNILTQNQDFIVNLISGDEAYANDCYLQRLVYELKKPIY